MCGIAALWGTTDRHFVSEMLEAQAQAHRGPDGCGLVEIGDGRGILGHCRLSIIDPAGGAQPLRAAEGNWSLVANGMIYNDREIRTRLADVRYATGSDSESILCSLAHDGTQAVGDLDGMFAFVMSDGERLIAARDPIGIKPLYMGHRNGALAFASEIKVLAAWSESIEEFPAGHVFDSRDGLECYYDVPPAREEKWRLEDALVAVRTTLEKAVSKRLRSDVPFGALLSGGLDSSVIAALTARQVDRLKTFAVGFDGSPDLLAARQVAAYIGSDHHELVITPQEALAELPLIVRHLESFDQDLVRSAVPCWFASRLAASKVKVVLTGEGADELYAGYTYYRDIADPQALSEELRRSITSMHNINLQRVDRMTMAHGLEARVPFLDREMIALAMTLPARWKLAETDGRRVEKWLLRKACEDLLPSNIVWRDKLQFDQGSGAADFIAAAAARLAGESALGTKGARSPEEAYYRSLLSEVCATPGPVLELVSHWDTRMVIH
jgi:asparagine synthase (glutamine-hydrolysing)